MEFKQKVKLYTILGIECVAILVLLLLVFFTGKQHYTVTFDLGGGTLIDGEVQQSVRQGGAALPPITVREGHTFVRWDTAYNKITGDTVITAVWECVTSPGLIFNFLPNSNYCTVSGSYEDIQGNVYVGTQYEGKTVLAIEEGAFKDRTGITKVFLSSGITAIGKDAFSGCTALAEVILPGTVTTLGESAFYNCKSLKSILLPNAITEIGNDTFYNCSSLAVCELPASLKTIGERAFQQCSSLTNVVLPQGVKSIGASAFRACSALVSVQLNEGLTKIGEYAFYRCQKLANLTVPESVPFDNVGVNAFVGTKLVFEEEYPTEIFIPVIRPPYRDLVDFEKVEKLPIIRDAIIKDLGISKSIEKGVS